MMMIGQHVGSRMKERRIMLGWSVREFADRIGFSEKVVSTAEHGSVNADLMYEIAKGLRVPIGYFFDGIDGEQLPPLTASERMRLELSRNFNLLVEKQQQALNDYVKALVEG